MTITESRRLALFEAAKTSWGEDTAQTLMDYLPFDPDAHATKADLVMVDANIRTEIAGVRSEVAQQTRLLMITTLTTTLTIVLAVLGAALAS